MVVVIMFAGCALIKPVQIQSEYRSIQCNSASFILPANFPNFCDEQEMKGYTGDVFPMGRSLIVLVIWEVDEDGNQINGKVFGFVFSRYSSDILYGLASLDPETQTWSYWNYDENGEPIPVTEEEHNEYMIKLDSV